MLGLSNMCRLFGFRSVIPSPVHQSLLQADNALGTQSNQHPDGWGVAHYVEGSPHVTKSPTHALADQLFHRLSGVVASQTVLAHVRKATQGDNGLLNCHPFQYGRWVFAHNGDLPDFAKTLRESVLKCILPRLRRFIMGDTDSEMIFLLLLTEIERRCPLDQRPELFDVICAVKSTSRCLRQIYTAQKTQGPVLLTFIVTDGDVMVAVQGGKELSFSTYKTRCPDRAHCPSLSEVCEAPSTTGHVNHLLISSEPLQGDNVWVAMDEGAILATDGRMRVMKAHLDRQVFSVLSE